MHAGVIEECVYIFCFHTNHFEFVLQKLIPFNEITSVRRAKTAGIFPNAIEIFAGSKKVLIILYSHFLSYFAAGYYS